MGIFHDLFFFLQLLSILRYLSISSSKFSSLQLWASNTRFTVYNFSKEQDTGSPIASKGRRGVIGVYTRHFSVNRHCDGGAYLLSVAPKKSSYSFTTATHLAG